MRGIFRTVGNVFWVLLGLFIAFALLVFVLKFSRRHLPSPLSNIANAAEGLIQP